MVKEFSSFRWFFLPYCLVLQADGSYVVTNRRYKPVGMTTTAHVDYTAHEVRVKFKKQLSTPQATKLSWNGSDQLDQIWLYNDGCVPTDSQANWDAYSLRLQRLADLQVCAA